MTDSPPSPLYSLQEKIRVILAPLLLVSPLTKFVIATVVILTMMGIFLTIRLNQLKKGQYRELEIPQYLNVLHVYPQGGIVSTKPKITIDFNLPVVAHHAEGFFELSPWVGGKLVQGENEKQIVFKPDSPFKAGSNVSVRLKGGLPSDKGKKLLADYNFYFFI